MAATEVYERILIGDEKDCAVGLALQPGEAMVHACKSPCHQRAVGYKKSLSPDHLNYLHLEYPNDLFLNLIDPPLPLFKLQSFQIFRRFATQHYTNGDTLTIHCNKGESRAPSLAMLFLSKQLQVIGDESYDVAREEFVKLYPGFTPGKGIETYMRDNWEAL